MIMITPDNVLRIVNYKRILFRPLSLQKNSVPCRISSNTSLILMWSKLVSNPQLVAARSLTCTHAHTYLNRYCSQLQKSEEILENIRDL